MDGKIYYFFSDKAGLKGFVNTKGQKKFLFENKKQAALAWLEKQSLPVSVTPDTRGGRQAENVLWLYCVTQTRPPQSGPVNGGYRSRPAYLICGAQKIEDIYSFADTGEKADETDI